MTATAKLPTFDFGDIRNYNPIYTHLFYRADRFIHLFGSAGSGKSQFACQKEIVLSFRSDRRGKRVLVVRRYENTLAGSVYHELQRVIAAWKLEDCFHVLKSPLSIKNKITGVEFIFRGLDDVEKLKSITGIDRILVEEATEIDNMSDLDQLDLRLRGVRNGQITLCYNPVNINHWLNTQIHELRPANHYILKTTYKDNVRLAEFEKRNNVTPTYAEILESKEHSNPNYWRIYARGEWGANPEGLVYPDYEVVPEMPEIQFYGLDFGYNDPCALIGGAIHDVMGQPRKNYYVKELLYETHLTSDLLVGRMNALGIHNRLPIVADCARPEMIAALRKAGYNVIPSPKGAGSVKAGIDLVKTFNLKVAAGSRELLKEIRAYSWQQKNGAWMEEPVDALNHALDSLRYALRQPRAWRTA